jgi:hypothetical protein
MTYQFLTSPERGCHGMDVDLFMTRPSVGPNPEAVAACRRCPFTAACLQFAEEIRDDHAYLGGTTGRERQRRRQERARPTPARQQTAARRTRVVALIGHGFSAREVAAEIGVSLAVVHADTVRHRARQAAA